MECSFFWNMRHNKKGMPRLKLLRFIEKLLTQKALLKYPPPFFFPVENIEQFDAAREFLKELDISENVWIGLMRPTNADQFSWT